ncbi:primosomal protein N' [Psychromicrobium xiongbiense]|uniref:primosomal protein N' n=1 Tax=Psychromicrobium xiongbiense TaxID=3051184 RepID=UPI00255660C3|nr:primosomal protein N' [Psychromicrobium sp. YIM S02556]
MSRIAEQDALIDLGPSPSAAGPEKPEIANSVAQVLIESPLPHLDRLFDYRVTADLDAEAQPGVRVKVWFAGRELPGFLVSRSERSSTSRTLSPLRKVVSAVPVLQPEILALVQAVAERYAGVRADILRSAIPPRVAKLDKDFLSRDEAPDAAETPVALEPAVFEGYERAGAFLDHLAGGGSPRAALSSLQGYGARSWAHQLTQAVAATALSGRGAIVVLPNQRDLDQLSTVMAEALGPESFAVLSADDGPTARYRSFLSLLSGRRRIALGTRSAAFAPVRDLGLVCCWDDGDDVLIERRAPYQHAREVLLLRARLQGTAVLLAGFTRSTETQRLVESGWLQALTPARSIARIVTPRVVSSRDSFELSRDPLAASARLPERAWRAAQDGLREGPVLVQVARGGYLASLLCQQCREPARCRACQGPLYQPGRHDALRCRWCARVEPSFCCPHCGGTVLRRGVPGVARTAEEIGRAFPQVPVVSSAGDHVKATVPASPALVVATVGAEPVAEGGYAAALLLDGDSLLRRENLRAGEETLRRWFGAAALVRPARDGGVVVLTASPSPAVTALVGWQPEAWAERELAQRAEVGLPPAVRLVALSGSREAVKAFSTRLELPAGIRRTGPVPVESSWRTEQQQGGQPEASSRMQESEAAESLIGEHYRDLLFVPYAQAQQVLEHIRALKASISAGGQGAPVQVRCDGVDLL